MCGVTSNVKRDMCENAPRSSNTARKALYGQIVSRAVCEAVRAGKWPSEPSTHLEETLREIKDVLDRAGLTPIESEKSWSVNVRGYGMRTGRADLICLDEDGSRVLLDIKTYREVGEAERAQVSVYAHFAKRAGAPVTRAGLLIVPTTGDRLAGYIVWITPMTMRDAAKALKWQPEGGSDA